MASLQQYVNKEAEDEWRAREECFQDYGYKMPDQMVDEDGDRDCKDAGATPKKPEHKKEEGSMATTSKASASSSTAQGLQEEVVGCPEMSREAWEARWGTTTTAASSTSTTKKGNLTVKTTVAPTTAKKTIDKRTWLRHHSDGDGDPRRSLTQDLDNAANKNGPERRARAHHRRRHENQ